MGDALSQPEATDKNQEAPPSNIGGAQGICQPHEMSSVVGNNHGQRNDQSGTLFIVENAVYDSFDTKLDCPGKSQTEDNT